MLHSFAATRNFKEKRMTIDYSRRSAPLGSGALAVGAAAFADGRPHAATTDEACWPDRMVDRPLHTLFPA
jgi:hypothetical protein